MAEFPSLPLFTDAYLGDTTHLTTLEHGAYLLLLISMWRSKETRLPDDDKILSRYARLTAQQWNRIKPVIASFFDIENGFWTQGRLSDERVAVKQLCHRQSNRAKARWLKEKKTSMPRQCHGNASPTLPIKEDTNVSSSPLPPKEKFILPDWLPEEAWRNYSDHRKKPMTSHAKKLAVGTLKKLMDQGHDPVDVINQSIMRGWVGLFAIKPDYADGNKPEKKSFHRKMQEAAAEAVFEIEGREP